MAVVEILVDQRFDEPGPFGRHPAQESVRIQLGKNEVDGAAGLVELDLAAGPDDHAGVEGDAEPFQGGSDSPPDGRPALDAEGGSGVIPSVGGIHQVDEAMTLGQHLDRPDLPGDPNLLGERCPNGPVHLLVELGDGQGVAVPMYGHETGDA